ncbi:hypothetical protein BanimalisJ1_02300 [Bifidobacterium animalis]|nr:hypothetical protein BanimalisJ1_02300 [Bifidobacterium animalis]GEA00350.1 hypothetical protein BanimalisJ3_08080 [Bifidobacterium animalis]
MRAMRGGGTSNTQGKATKMRRRMHAIGKRHTLMEIPCKRMHALIVEDLWNPRMAARKMHTSGKRRLHMRSCIASPLD